MEATIPPVVPILDPTEAAGAVLEAVLRRDAVQAVAQSQIASDEMWVYGCNAHPSHAGIIFAVDPGSVGDFHGGLWTAIYRPKGVVPFWGLAQEVICQQCFVETGEKVPLRIAESVGQPKELGLVFHILPEWRRRFAHKLSRSALAKFLPPSKDAANARPDAQPAVAAPAKRAG
jgi:hypothetical protein